MIERVVIKALDGYTPKIGVYLAKMEDVRGLTLKYVEGMSPEQLAWSPNDTCESIATLLLHIAAAERSWIGEDIMERPMNEWWKIAFPIRFDIPQISGKKLSYFTDILANTRQETKDALQTLTDDDLSREIAPLDPSEQDNAEKRFSIEWILYHLIEHEAHHKGQIAVMKRLWPL